MCVNKVCACVYGRVYVCVYKGRAMLKWPGHVRGQVAGMREVEVCVSMFSLCVCTSRGVGGLKFRARGSCCFERAARCVPFFPPRVF